MSLDVAAGEQSRWWGPSGSGKSTLLSCLAGLTIRTVALPDPRVADEPPAAVRPDASTSASSPRGGLFDHLTVAANVELVRRLTPRRPRRSVEAVLGAVGLKACARAYPGELSGGESARAGLAVALAVDPAVVLADEPTGELDSTTEGEILDLLRATARSDVAVVVGSHSPALAEAADRVVALRDGWVQP